MSFIVVGRTTRRPAGGADPAADQATRAAEVAQQVAVEVARQWARTEAEGRAFGEAAARSAVNAQTVAATHDAVAALREACSQLVAPLAQKERDLADLVTDLSFELARHIVGVEVAANPDSLKALVSELLREASSQFGARQSIIVRLHPADQTLLSGVMQLDAGHLLADAAISRGGAIVEIFSPEGSPLDKVEWDATIESRIATLQAALALDGPASGAPP